MTKKISYSIIVIVIFCTSFKIFALPVTSKLELLTVSAQSGTVTVTGKMTDPSGSGQMTVLVYPAGSDYNNADNVLYLNQFNITLDSEDKFSLSFPMTVSSTHSNLTLRMGGQNISDSETYDFEYIKQTQLPLTVNNVPGKKTGDADFQLTTTGGSGTGAITFTKVSGPCEITPSGMVTITGAGDIVVNATKAEDDNYDSVTSADCTISIAEYNLITKVTLNKSSLSLIKGKTEKLTATVQPENANNKNITWESDNTSVAKVDTNGNVTALKGGTAKITVTTDENQFTAFCTVTVTSPSTSVTLNKSNKTLKKGRSFRLTAKMLPADTNDKMIWSSSSPKIAKVTQTGIVTGKSAGKAVITVKTGSGKTAACKVTVRVPAKSIKLNRKVISIEKSKTYKLKVTLSKGSNDTIKWKSHNRKIAKITKKGIVTGIRKGKTKITVKTGSGKFAICTVIVK